MCSKGEDWSHVLRCERTGFRSINAEIDIRGIVGCKNKEQWQQIGMYVIRYKEKWEKMVRENESEV
jgi:hypothetical protein